MTINSLKTIEFIEEIKNKEQKIALAVEGGGLRGIVSASLLECLCDLGLRDNIVSIAGTSSGAINAAYFLDNKMSDCIALYRKMASKEFIQPNRWPDAMNLNYLFEKQISNNFPLDLKNLRTHKKDFFVTITNIETGITEAKKAQEMETDEDVLALIRASTSAPLYSTNKESLANNHYNDGHIQMPIPFRPLLKSNVDYIFCLMTQKKGYVKKSSIVSSLHQKLALRKYTMQYKRSYSQSNSLYNILLEEIEGDPRIIPLQLDPSDFLVSKMSKDPSEIDLCRQNVRRRFLGHS